jgi:hypothetical protein
MIAPIIPQFKSNFVVLGIQLKKLLERYEALQDQESVIWFRAA